MSRSKLKTSCGLIGIDMPFHNLNSIITKVIFYTKNGSNLMRLDLQPETLDFHLGVSKKKGLWRSMVKNPNSPNNRFRHQKIVNNERSLLKVRQEAFTRFKSEGAGDHLALVKAINFVGIADTSPKRNHRSRRRKNPNKRK